MPDTLLALITYLEAQVWRGYLHILNRLGPLFGFDYPDYKVIEMMLDFYQEAAAESKRLLIEFWRERGEDLPDKTPTDE